jgi:hypothetical protein
MRSSGHLTIDGLADQPEGAVVVGQVPHQAFVWIGHRPGLLELLAQELRRRHVCWVGDRLAACPDPVVDGDEASLVTDFEVESSRVVYDGPE